MSEFHPSGPVRSRNYNYTVDYFELRAQPGRDGLALPGDILWYRDDNLNLLYPIYFGDDIVIGGTTLKGNEKLRVVGAIDVLEVRIGDSVIKQTGSGLTFQDVLYGPVSLKDIGSLFWSRDEGSGALFLTNSDDNVLLGQSTGDPFKKLQITSYSSDGLTYLIYGKNSLGDSIFWVNDLGHIYGSKMYFGSVLNYIQKGSGETLEFFVNGAVAGTWSPSGLSHTNWAIRNSNPVFARTIGAGYGLGFPTSTTIGLYFDGSSLYNFSSNTFSFPQNSWIQSGINLLRVNPSGEIELNEFKFIPSERKFLLNENTYMYRDVFGNMMFRDNILGSEVSLSQLAGTASVYWERNAVMNTISPKYPLDDVVIPKLAGVGNRAVVADSTGKLITHAIVNFWKRDLIMGGAITKLFYATDYLVIGYDGYITDPDHKVEIWDDGDFVTGFSSSGMKINVPLLFEDSDTAVYKNAEDELEFKDAEAGSVTLSQLAGYIHTQGIASDTWSISHGLNRKAVIVQVYDVNGKEYKAEVEHIDDNNSVIRFGFSMSGYAQCR